MLDMTLGKDAEERSLEEMNNIFDSRETNVKSQSWKIIQLQLAHVFVKMLWLHRAPAKGRSCDFKLHKLLIFGIVWTFAIRSVFQLIKIRQLLNIFYIQGSKQSSFQRRQPS